MWLAYNTNGLAHHRLEDACALLADLGYAGIALTPDVGQLDLATTGERDWERARTLLERHRLRCVVETGARFALDPRRKHWPNLLTADAAAARRRSDWYRRALALAAALGAQELSLWSGATEAGDAPGAALVRLVERLPPLLDEARRVGVTLCFEPEPGMLIDSLSAYRTLRARLGRDDLATTIDVGHLLVTEAGPAHLHLAEFAPTLRNVQLDDARRGVHHHLPLGDGDLELAPLLRELARLDYRGPLALELSRDSHRGADAAAAALESVRRAWPPGVAPVAWRESATD
ncbi:MAG: sugar phosphate isomerase/epimerase [Planctomycetes bacterium]|nr:sugar phosphate isomerase/epimerase [Planctomycetota bacterium]